MVLADEGKTIYDLTYEYRQSLGLIFIRTELAKLGDSLEDHNRVSQISVIHPAKHKPSTKLIYDRLRDLLEYYGFEVAAEVQQDIWTPKQDDNWSCGLHVYDTIRVLTERIATIILKGRPNGYSETLWDALSGIFEPEKVRLELMGVLASCALISVDYKARVVIRLSTAVRDSKGNWKSSNNLKHRLQRRAFQKPPNSTRAGYTPG